MPSTYSTNLKLELMATGEKNNLWGGITNTNLGSLLEEAIVGAATVAMADANQTISITNGASSTGRCVYIKCTGALTAGRNLTVPTINKNYIVENATTGGFDVTVKTGAGTGIAVKPATKRAVYADATNVVESLSGFGALTVTSLAASAAVTALTVNGLTITTSTGTLTVTNAKTFSVSNTITLTGTDAASYDLGSGGAICPAGVVWNWAGGAAPTGWLLCDGSSVLRATYAALFTAIGVTFGSVDGTHFTLPDLRGRVIAGRDDMGGSAASRLTNSTITSGATTVGNVGGTQTEAASVSVGGSTSGALSVTTNSTSMDGDNADIIVQSGGGANVANAGHAHANVASSGITSGALSVTATGATATVTNVQPTIIMNMIIKT